jgi:ribosome biogenesis protein BRX1
MFHHDVVYPISLCIQSNTKTPFLTHTSIDYLSLHQIWVRNYQIVEEHATNAKEANTEKKLTGSDMKTSLVEIGPRFVLNPIRIFRGSFGGQTLFQNEQFVSPNAVRAEANRNKGHDYEGRKVNQRKRKEREDAIVLPDDPLDSVFQ